MKFEENLSIENLDKNGTGEIQKIEEKQESKDYIQNIEDIWDDTAIILQQIGLKLNHPEWLQVLQGKFNPAKHFSGNISAFLTFINPFMETFNHVTEDILTKAHIDKIDAGEDSEFGKLYGKLIENKKNIRKNINELKK